MNLRNTSTTNDTIAISWDAATTTFCGNILKYYVTISYDDGTLVNGTSTEQKTHRFDGLQNNTCYIILALANNAAGNGTAIAMIVQTTGPQGNLKVVQVHLSTFHIWFMIRGACYFSEIIIWENHVVCMYLHTC